jgi:hypothetical protein
MASRAPALRSASPKSTATFPGELGFISKGIKRTAKYLTFRGNLFGTWGHHIKWEGVFSLLSHVTKGYSLAPSRVWWGSEGLEASTIRTVLKYY